jgi:predicted nuclease of predicted toxin-antitoxin system
MSHEPRLFIAVYTDEDITSELAPALRERGFDAISAYDADLLGKTDNEQLAFATKSDRSLLTCNASDFLRLAKIYSEESRTHSGIIISSEQYSRRQFGELLRQTLLLLNSLTADEMANNIVFLQAYKE